METCDTCEWAGADEPNLPADFPDGLRCQFNPPVPIKGHGGIGAVYPPVRASWGCSKHSPRQAPEGGEGQG